MRIVLTMLSRHIVLAVVSLAILSCVISAWSADKRPPIKSELDPDGGLVIDDTLKEIEPPAPADPREAALCDACNKGQDKVVEQLIGQGVKPDIPCGPLSWAAHRGHKHIAWFLLDHGADPNFAPPHEPPPLFKAMTLRQESPMLGHPENAVAMVELLLRWKANPEALNSFEETPLMFAAGRGDLEMVLVLIKNGAKINTRTEKGDTALSHARKRGQLETVRALLDLGAE